MKSTRLMFVSSTVLLALAIGGLTAVAQSSHIVVTADKLQWGPAPPVLPPGAQLAVLEGNPGEKGPVVMRLKMPANYRIPAHWHTNDERLTILSGTFYIGGGDKLNMQAGQAVSAGGYISLPGKMHHYAWTTVPTILQINLEGPFDMFYIDPNDDPQKVRK